ncbi:hypothetical protein [Allopontixanthobacter sp.]|uniref:hypothetical protein n=1 Tax=Allopontixanthobacter sp. TaxID=2906452 RepID=UPI002AB8F577|nr:hypothetical protein [Allopontixanthobacter sp.]MDZ4307999.1 hypothetical protein [Allopontixanthobacter sp.]
MGIFKIAALSAVGYAGYKYFEKHKDSDSPAFATGQTGSVRDAGPTAMRDQPNNWNKTDQESDESFPASDAPGNY